MSAAVRARHLKLALAALRGRPREECEAVLAKIPPEILRAIDESVGVEWFPMPHDLAVTRAIDAALGRGEADRFWRRLAEHSMETPLFRTLVEGARALFGATPAAWARWIPQGWDLIFRDCGSWSVIEGENGRAMLRSQAIPRECASDPVWLAAVASSFSGIVGKVEVGQVDSEVGRVEFFLPASPPRPLHP
jgi:hypothetical protein